jgi:hypothetical protein
LSLLVLPGVLALDLSPADQSKLKQLIVRRDKVEDQMGALVSSRRGARVHHLLNNLTTNITFSRPKRCRP